MRESGGRDILEQAESLYHAGTYAAAAAICHDILSDDPEDLEAIFLLANIAYARAAWRDAVQLYRHACRLEPDVGFLRVNLALALLEAGELDEALIALDEAERLGECSTRLHYNRGVVLQRLGNFERARFAFEQALAVDPGHNGAWINLSAVCLETGDDQGAIQCCRHGLALEPLSTALMGNLATAYGKLYRFEESLAWYRRLLEVIQPEEQAEVLGRMANCFCDNWQVDLGIACFDRAIAMSTDCRQQWAIASTRLFVLHYSPAWSSEAIAAEHRKWGALQPTRPVFSGSFDNNRDPDRRIRVAYLSPDLRIHAVVFFLQPVLAAHDLSQVEVFCYSDVKKPDAVTRQIREGHDVVWRDCAGCNDEDLKVMLAEDRIDILVDLAGHTGSNRLPLFAQRAAPLQVTWIGYPNTTGLASMDYRISDNWADPPGMTEHLHTEQLLRMPDSFLCYRPGGDFPDIGEPPCLSHGQITFGSFSNFMKVTPAMLELWAGILAAVTDSRLVFRARGMTTDRFNREIAPIFKAQGVDLQRVTVLGHARSVVENLLDYHRIDIALDTFPYNGTTTTCESLCMGVPVVTLAGDAHLSRVGVSLLSTMGLYDLIAKNGQEYQSIAVNLANDRRLLQSLRYDLRQRLLESPLTNNITFTAHLESLYRQIWQRWCDREAF